MTSRSGLVAAIAGLAALTAGMPADTPATVTASAVDLDAAVAELPPPGCDPSRPVVAHHAGGRLLADDDPRITDEPSPIACMTVTGNAIEAATIGVTSRGTVFFGSIEQFPTGSSRSILRPSVVARSVDDGATWHNRVPGGGPVSPHLSLSTWSHVDPATSRVWYATPSLPCGATISWSDDEGETWRTHPNIGCPGQGAAVLMEGPPAPAAEPPRGYPHVVYYCANGADGTGSVLFCHRSRDGGTTWRWTGSTPDPGPTDDGCPPTDNRRTRAGTVGPDGVLYFPTWSCDKDRLGLAVSHDEGATWTRQPVLETPIADLYPPALAVDAGGGLYIGWRGDDGRPYVTASTDGGETWSEPLMVGHPEVTEFRRLGVVARDSGHLLVTYVGAGPDGINAYMTESRNATAVDPVFWSAAVNPPDEPVHSGSSETFGDRMWFLRGHIADDGTPWGAFHCFDTAPLCPDGQRLGIAARLHRPGGA